MNRATAQTSAAPLWWVHPFWFMAVPLLAVSLAAYLIPEADFQESWRTAKAFDSSDLAICAAVAGTFTMGCMIASWLGAGFSLNYLKAPGPRNAWVGRRELKILFDIAFIVTITGYVIWFGSILKQGGIGMFVSMLTGGAKGASDDVKRAAMDAMITGVTTFTQFGMGTALLGIYLGFTQGWGKVAPRLALLLGVTALRAVFLSERLSLIEIVLPSVVLIIRLFGFGRHGSALRRFLVVTPVVGVCGLYLLFTFTEYFRSWNTFYADRGDQSLFEFSMLRLLGYYVTALNNGAIEWHAHGALNFPYATMDWLWRFPVIGEGLQAMLGGNNDPALVRTALLTADGNPEFNNTSGIFIIFIDLGMAGALLFFTLFGFVAGLLHGSYCRGSVAGMFLYPFLVIGMSEQMLIMYVSSGRSFPTWLLLLTAALISFPRMSRGRSVRKSGAPCDRMSSASCKA